MKNKALFFFLSFVLMTIFSQSVYGQSAGGHVTRQTCSDCGKTVQNCPYKGNHPKSIGTSDYNGHQYVDLGLSVKWASCNVGASTPEGYGSYYAWGELNTKSKYTWVNYRFRVSGDEYDNVIFSKYNTDSSLGNVDGRDSLDIADDVAHVKWGGNWRMPTYWEFQELIDECSWSWTIQNGVKGYKVISNKSGYKGRYIFLPATGIKYETGLEYLGKKGGYWTSYLFTDVPQGALYLIFENYEDSKRWELDWNYRNNGISVRPVCP